MASVKTGTFREAQDAYEQLGLGQPPPSGLVPIGDTGLYRTPDTPADPFDPNRYPDSPYVGGNPIGDTPLGIEIETTVMAQPCGVTRSITATPTVVFVKLPPVSIAHIPENCREEYEKQGENYVPPPPDDDLENYEPTPQYRPYGFDLNSQVCVVTVDYYSQEIRRYNPELKKWGRSKYQISGNVLKTNYPTGAVVPWYSSVGKVGLAKALVDVQSTVAASNFLDAIWTGNKIFSNSGTENINFRIPPDQPKMSEISGQSIGGDYRVLFYYPTGNAFIKSVAVYVGRLGDIFPNKQISPITNSTTRTEDGKQVYRTIHERFVVYCQKISGDTSDRRPPPLKRPKKECCEDMGCCQPPYRNQQQQDLNEIRKQLRDINRKIGDFPISVSVFDANEDKLGAQTKVERPTNVASAIRLAIERNEKLAKILGIDLLPITVPKTVIEKKGEGIFSQIFGFLDFNKNEEINSILEMQTWMFQQLSGILGHWMMEIEVEDNDPLKAGKQDKDGKTKSKEEEKKPEKVVLPNIALTMREQVAMQIQTLKALGMVVDMQIKSLIDLAGTKVLSAECAARLEDLQMYFDYETEEVTEDLPLQITFPNLNGKREDVENLANFLKEGKVKVSYDRWTVQKSQSLEEKIIQLLEMSSAIRALYFHNGA